MSRPRRQSPRQCEVIEHGQRCPNRVHAHDMCSKHHLRWLLHDDPLITLRTPRRLQWLQTMFVLAIWNSIDTCIVPDGVKANDYWHTRDHQHHQRGAHVIVCEWMHGPRPPGRQVAHGFKDRRCVSRGCINPRHLRWETKVGNDDDKLIHGTISNRLSPHRVRMAKDLRAQGWAYARIASVFGITNPNVISKAVRGETWGWLPQSRQLPRVTNDD